MTRHLLGSTNRRRAQRTLARTAALAGFGYWSGQDVRVELRPAPPHTGIVFVRADLGPSARIPARVEYRIDMPRRTTLRHGDAEVQMVEHILAALAGLQLDNVEVWVDAAEMPGLDGSSQPLVEALDAAGAVTQEAPRQQLVVERPVRIGDERAWVEATPAADEGLTLSFVIDYGPGNPIGLQSLERTLSPRTFREELATSRTFLLEEEARWLQSQGLGSRVGSRDLLIFNDQGPIDNPLRFADECVRHKMLDLCGDLALAGCDIAGHVRAYCSGHHLNADLVRTLVGREEQLPRQRRSA